jgi:2-hydroxychromene-2-carboxylate isomerase
VQQVYGDGPYAEVDKRIWQLRGPMQIEDFEGIAAEMGLDFPKLEAAMESDAVTARIDYNRDAAIALEVFGTPAFLAPNSLIVGSTDIDLLSETWLGQ